MSSKVNEIESLKNEKSPWIVLEKSWNSIFLFLYGPCIYVAKTKALTSCGVTMQLICAFVFAYMQKVVLMSVSGTRVRVTVSDICGHGRLAGCCQISSSFCLQYRCFRGKSLRERHIFYWYGSSWNIKAPCLSKTMQLVDLCSMKLCFFSNEFSNAFFISTLYLQVVSELRANLEFDSSTAGKKQKKKTSNM